MEQLNSEPVAISSNENTVTDKQAVLSTKFQVSYHFIRNNRRKLEDRLVIENDLNAAFDLDLPHKYRYIAIFDGHVNENAADFCKNRLHLNLIENEKFKSGHDVRQALKEAFLQTDQEFCDSIANESMRPGTTALVCLVEDDRRLYVAWAGDSTAILIRDGQPVMLTPAHTPEREDERERVKRMGGECMYTNMWRVMGILAVSRSIGDPDYKPYVTAEPDIVELELNGSEDFLVLASDGLFDTLTPEDASTIVYEFLALNADRQDGNKEQEKKIVESVSNMLVQRSVEEGSSDNITTVVLFLKDLATIAPSLKPIKQNGHQNGHQVNGHQHDDESATAIPHNGLNGTNSENGNKTFPLNINAMPFSPNMDLFNNISMSGIESIRNQQQKAWEDCVQANINVTSNEDNVHDDNLQCAINDEMNAFGDENDEQPQSILPNINDQLATDSEPAQAELSKDDDELERELDEERVVVKDDEKLDELDEDEIHELKATEAVEETQDAGESATTKTVECEYGVIPSESTASPVDLISESTTMTDQHDEVGLKDSNENLPNSPFEQIVDEQPPTGTQDDQQADREIKIKVNDQTFNIEDSCNLKEAPREEEADLSEKNNEIQDSSESKNEVHEEDEKSEENSFEFIELSQPAAGLQDQNVTQYESPENSNLSKLPGLQEECSVYGDANPTFDNSILNRDLQYRQQQLDDQEDDSHPFENDSEDSIKYLDKTATDQALDQAFVGDAPEVDDLADLMANANINQTESVVTSNEVPNDQTLNLLEDTRMVDQENIDEMNKENVPQLIQPVQTNLLDSTLMFTDAPPLIPSSNANVNQLEQINEDHFDDEEMNDENQAPSSQPQQSASSNFEMIKDEELTNQADESSPANQFSENSDNNTNYKQFDMDLTHCGKTELVDIHFNPNYNAELIENQAIIDEKVPSQHLDTGVTESAMDIDDDQDHDRTLKNDLDQSSSEYIQAQQDQSFLHKANENRSQEDSERPEFVEELAVDESKDFVVLESPPPQSSSNEADLAERNDALSTQSSELSPELNEQPPVVVPETESGDLTSKPEVVDERSKALVGVAAAGVVAAAAAVASTVALSTKKKATPTSSSSKAKLTKDTKPVVKDSKVSTASKSPPKDTKPSSVTKSSSSAAKSTALARKPLTSTLSTNKVATATASKPSTASTTATRKPLSTSTTTKPSVTSTTASSRLLTKKPASSSTVPATSKSSSTLLASKPTVSRVASRLTTAAPSSTRPIVKSTVASSTTAKSSLASKAPAATAARPATSRPATSKYANVTSKVSSSLAATAAAKPAATSASRPAASTATKPIGLAAKKPVSSALRTSAPSTTKPSTSKPLTSVTSKVSSIRSTAPASSTAQSKLNSKPTAKPTAKSAASKVAGSTGATKKITAVPRKPVNSSAVVSSNGTATTESKSSTTQTNTVNSTDQTNENSNSIKPNSQLANGQSQTNSSNGLPNGTVSQTATSITSSKSRDKLTNSLKAELEAALLEAESTPK